MVGGGGLLFELLVSCRLFAAIPPLYTKDHEWIVYDESTKIGTFGISNHAQKALGDVVYVELPTKGKVVKQKGTIAAVESVKAASGIIYFTNTTLCALVS